MKDCQIAAKRSGTPKFGGDVAESRNASVAPGEVQGSRPAVTAEASRVHRASCVCGWKATGKDLMKLDRRVIRHCEACGGPVEIEEAVDGK